MSPPRSISTLLVANRGEIARRVIRSAHGMGLRTVAVYSDADRTAAHVREADAAVRIGPAPAAQSYLDIGAILDAARVSGADAVHPGYGFLSERAEFARAVTEAGLTFVGPTADVMEVMGRKDKARAVAVDAGVPVVPSAELPAGSDAVGAMTGSVDALGFPLMVKAAAGGGGKGMRIVREPGDLEAALASARREALAAFGDDTILLERYVEHGRHIEVQVIGDTTGTVVHLFERDCSTQRRHQKVLEEAPAPTITEEVRRVLTDSAVALASSVGYTNAGTVEFLVDPEAGSEGVYFLEMNTRLQVEHPVTELAVSVAGRPLDLVELQLRVAAGEPLPFTQDDVRLTGHAIEARVYAEDPSAGFLPQAGVADFVRWSPRARVDAALESGQAVGTSYDPMLGKVIVSGASREAARRSLVTALDDTAILGLTTNLGLLRALAASEAFARCEIDTAWLDRNLSTVALPSGEIAGVLAAWALAFPAPADQPGDNSGGHSLNDRDRSPFTVRDGWRLAGPPAPIVVELISGKSSRVYEVTPTSVIADDRTWVVHPVAAEPGMVAVEIDGQVHEAAVSAGAHGIEVGHRGASFRFSRPDAFGPAALHAVSDGTVTAPMPGTLLDVVVAEGQEVDAGDVLGVLEAMKMELSLKAPTSGVIARVAAATGDQVALGAVLFVVDPAAPPAAASSERVAD